jgi:hypothetical protein
MINHFFLALALKQLRGRYLKPPSAPKQIWVIKNSVGDVE